MKETLIEVGIFVLIVVILSIKRLLKNRDDWNSIFSMGFGLSVLGSVLIFAGINIWDQMTFPEGERQFKVEIYQKAYDTHGKVIQKESRYAIYYEFPFRRKRYIEILNFNDLLDKERPLYYKQEYGHYYYKSASTFTKDEANKIVEYLNDKNRTVIEKTY
jgi:hypothetical protein